MLKKSFFAVGRHSSRKRESSLFKAFWTPAFAGVTLDAGFPQAA
jgi:hypothetical protein